MLANLTLDVEWFDMRSLFLVLVDEVAKMLGSLLLRMLLLLLAAAAAAAAAAALAAVAAVASVVAVAAATAAAASTVAAGDASAHVFVFLRRCARWATDTRRGPPA